MVEADKPSPFRPKATFEVLAPLDYDTAQDAYRAKHAEVAARGVAEAHTVALNAAIHATVTRLLAAGWLPAGRPQVAKAWLLSDGGAA